MSAVALVARQRLARSWGALVAMGILLGLGFGLCQASVAAARRTESAYERILAAAEAPDAAVAGGLGQTPEQIERSLRTVDGVVDQRVYGGFVGRADGLAPALSTALIAPIEDRFPLELPKIVDGRLPDPDVPDEVFVTSGAAELGGLEVGQRLHFRFVHPLSPRASTTNEMDVTISGIGDLPVQAVGDETQLVGLFVFTRAFYDTHRDMVVYSTSNVDLARGVDARRDLASAVGALGHRLQSVRTQETHAANEASRPGVIVLVAFGMLAFTATAVAAAQVVQRSRDRWLADTARLRAIGMDGRQIRTDELLISGLVAAVAAVTAFVTMLLVSPIAPVGPLHDLDPSRGFDVDGTVAVVGAVAVVATIALLALLFSSARTVPPRRAASRSSLLAGAPRHATTIAGLTLAFRGDSRRGGAWRSVVATTAAALVLAVCAAFVASAVTLTDTPTRYGLDADLVAVNPYGDQAAVALDAAFADRDDVDAATGFTTASFVVDGRAVPGLAATTVKGDLGPTLLRGRPALAGDEIVLGSDTLESIGADVGDAVLVQMQASAFEQDDPTGDAIELRVVGVATFPAVNQIGTDMPRLGTGALVTRGAFLRMGGNPHNDPEFAAVRMVDGADPAAVIADNPDGFQDAAQSTTSWFTDAKPAELRQLDVAMPYLRAGLVIGFLILLGVVVHALWTRILASRHDLAVLRAVGSTGSQVDAVTAWQAVPFALGALLLGVPIGIALGRRAFALFAQSLAVVDDASVPASTLVVLVTAVLLAAAVAGLTGIAVARRSGTAAALRAG
jgi:hypothetical protein